MSTEEIGEVSDNIVRVCEKAFKLLEQKVDLRASEDWEKRINTNIRLINKAFKKGTCNHGTLIKLQTNLGHLKRFKTYLKSLRHTGKGQRKRENRSDRVKWEDTKSAFQRRIRSGIIINLKHKDILQFFKDAFYLFKNRINRILRILGVIKVNAVFCGEFVKKSGETEIVDNKYFNTKYGIIDRSTQLKPWFQDMVIDKILKKIETFEEQESGWSLKEILSLEININKTEVGNGVGGSYIKLPRSIELKRACINVQNSDNMCFAWAIVSALYPPVGKKPRRTSSYPHPSSVLNLDGLEFPLTLNQISKFENLNKISVNVYMLDLVGNNNQSNTFVTSPARITKNKMEKHVNLLLVQNEYFPKINDYEAVPDDESTCEIRYHYCWIKDISRLISKQTNHHKAKLFICDRCLNYYSSKKKLDEHEGWCQDVNNCKISFPKDKYIEFKNYVHKERVPFIIYADFEAILKSFHDSQTSTKTAKYQEHEPFNAGYYFKCSYDDTLSFYKSYRGTDCMSWFANQMEEIATLVSAKLKYVEPMNEVISLEDATPTCHICEKEFTASDIIVRDHSHLTSHFRGYAHVSCNLNYKESFVVPIVFHNLSGYDSHFIIRDLAKKHNVTLLPLNKEKYISFTVSDSNTNIKFRFIDSFRFLGFSLDTLASSLKISDFVNTRKEFCDVTQENFSLLTKKGVFCYDYIDGLDKLEEKSLPSIERFYNELRDANIDPVDYQHAQLVWEKFNIKTLGQYSDLYLKTDIMLLTDVFENFRNTCLKNYSLDPAWYYTLPGYTWDCMLKYTGCKLETFQDVDILMFFERGIRGGISQCCNRYSEANNKYMNEYDSTKPSKYLLYLDVNNLYGWAMSEYLPYGGFKWVDTNIDVTTIPDDNPEGYILEVTLDYPEDLHYSHRDLPFCAEHRKSPTSRLPKLMTTFYPKEKYVVHYRTLKQALLHGLVLKAVHRVLKFDQSAWLAPYIKFNTDLRTKAKFDFEKTIMKLMNNAVFGKTMQNIRKHRIVKLVPKWDGRYGMKNLIASPAFNSRLIIDENLVAIELNKTNIVFNKPLYIGMAILDISKIRVYDFHYDYMLQKFSPEECKLLYTDTDSLLYEIKCNDVYSEVIRADLHRFDTSDYPIDNQYDIPLVNKKVPGLMKDELNGKIMTHFAGLRSKMYTFLVDEGKTCIKKSKGVTYCVVKNHLTFDDYVNCLFKKQEKTVTQCSIRSFAHNVFSIKQTKIALSPFDDKRYLVNNVDTLPWGHKDIIS